jgi:hypothetical protein
VLTPATQFRGAALARISVHATVNALSYSDDGTLLKTNRGLVQLPKFLINMPDIMPPPSDQIDIPCSVFVKEQWIPLGTEDVLWLPPEYRPSYTLVDGNIVALGLQSSLVLILELGVIADRTT